MSSREDWENLEAEEATEEAARMMRNVATGTVTVGLATIAGPVAAAGAIGVWAVKTLMGINKRDSERNGEE